MFCKKAIMAIILLKEAREIQQSIICDSHAIFLKSDIHFAIRNENLVALQRLNV